MSRTTSAAGEKLLLWLGSSKRDLLAFPEPVKDEIGVALSVANLEESIPMLNLGRVKERGYSR